jgi:hypothetical protein
LTKGKRHISSVTTEVKKHGNGAHVIVPKEWIGIEVDVIPRRQPTEEPPPPIKSKEDLENDYNKFRSKARGAARLAKKNVNLSESAEK